MMADYYKIQVTEVLDHGEAEQGMLVGVKVADDQGQECVILIPHETVGAFFATLQAAAEFSEKKRRERGITDDTSAYLTKIESMNIGVLSQGSISLRLRLKGGMNLDFPIPSELVGKLRDDLGQADGGGRWLVQPVVANCSPLRRCPEYPRAAEFDPKPPLVRLAWRKAI